MNFRHFPALLAFFLTFTLAAPASADTELPDATRFSVVLELGDVKAAERWLDAGLDPNFEGQLIGTGMMIGAWEGNIPLMELFLARGADIHRANRFGETALMLAAWKNRPAAMRWLLDHGAQPNRTEREWTALHYASFAGHAELVDHLLAAGADINARSTNGSTVIMMAAREGHATIAKQLLAAGANPALKNDFDDDAVSWAMRQRNFDIAKSFTSAENFAELARLAVQEQHINIAPKRSLPAPDAVDELLRMARLAETRGNRDEALAAYRKALAELKTLPSAALKNSSANAAKKSAAAKKGDAVKGIVIRARRDQPNQQALTLDVAGDAADAADATERLLAEARAAEQAGNRTAALKLFRAAAERLKTTAATGR